MSIWFKGVEYNDKDNFKLILPVDSIAYAKTIIHKNINCKLVTIDDDVIFKATSVEERTAALMLFQHFVNATLLDNSVKGTIKHFNEIVGNDIRHYPYVGIIKTQNSIVNGWDYDSSFIWGASIIMGLPNLVNRLIN